MSISVEFYNNRSDENVVNKQLTLVDSYSFQNVYDIDTKNPYFKISIGTVSNDKFKWQRNTANKNGVNYCKVKGKYYYVTSVKTDSKFLYIYLKVDVLMSYKSAILASTQLVTRSEKYFNRYLNDENYKALNYNRLQFKRFPAGFTGDYKYIMLVGGGS